MSISYTVELQIMHPLTDEIRLNFLKKAKEIGGIANYKSGLQCAFEKLKRQESTVFMWQDEPPEDSSYQFYPFVYLGAYSLSPDSFKFYLKPSGSNRWGRGWASLGIEFNWYIEKALKITSPLPIATLKAEIGDAFAYCPIEWTIFASVGYLSWPHYPMKLSDWDELKSDLDKAISNGIKAGYSFDPYPWNEQVWSQDYFNLHGHAPWGDFIIQLRPKHSLFIKPQDPNYTPQDLRPYLELLSTLCHGFEVTGVLADSLALKLF